MKRDPKFADLLRKMADQYDPQLYFAVLPNGWPIAIDTFERAQKALYLAMLREMENLVMYPGYFYPHNELMGIVERWPGFIANDEFRGHPTMSVTQIRARCMSRPEKTLTWRIVEA